MARSNRRNSEPNPNRPLLIVLGLFVAFILFAAFFFQNYLGVKYGPMIAALYIMAVTAAFLFGIFYYAQHVLPYRSGESWYDGLSLIWRNLTSAVSPGGKLPIVGIEDEELDESFETLKAGILRSHQVLAIYKGNRFSRAAGPGFVRLYRGEDIDEVVDLRTHKRTHPLKVHTRDGIPVESNASVTFRVRRDVDHTAETGQYTFDRQALFEVSHSSSIKIDDQIVNWSEQVAAQAASYGVSEIAQYTLEELPRHLGDINKRVQRDLQDAFHDNGIEIMSASVGGPKPPADIQQQHLRNWQAVWERRRMQQEAANQGEALRRLERARARAQVEIIQTIMESIDEMRRNGQSDLTNIVTLRMIEVLEHAMDNQIVAEPIVETVLQDTSKQLKALIEPSGESSSEGDGP